MSLNVRLLSASIRTKPGEKDNPASIKMRALLTVKTKDPVSGRIASTPAATNAAAWVTTSDTCDSEIRKVTL